jgi:hypothetical protein
VGVGAWTAQVGYLAVAVKVSVRLGNELPLLLVPP